MNAQEFLKKYANFSEETKQKCFTKSQRELLEKLCFFNKMFNDPAFYDKVYTAVATEVYNTLKNA